MCWILSSGKARILALLKLQKCTVGKGHLEQIHPIGPGANSPTAFYKSTKQLVVSSLLDKCQETVDSASAITVLQLFLVSQNLSHGAHQTKKNLHAGVEFSPKVVVVGAANWAQITTDYG